MLEWHWVPRVVFTIAVGHGYLAHIKTWYHGNKKEVSYYLYGTSIDVKKLWCD